MSRQKGKDFVSMKTGRNRPVGKAGAVKSARRPNPTDDLRAGSRRRLAGRQPQLELAGVVQAGGRTTAAGDRNRRVTAPDSRWNRPATESHRRPADGQLQLELAGVVQAGGRTTAAGDRNRQADKSRNR